MMKPAIERAASGSNAWYPRLTAAMILLGSLVQVKGFGFALVCEEAVDGIL